MRPSNRLNQSLEKPGNQRFKSDHIADFQNLQQLSEEGSFLGTISERPVSQQSIDKLLIRPKDFPYRDCKSWVLAQEEH